MATLDTSYSVQLDNMSESPCLGFLPPSSSPLLRSPFPEGALLSTNQPIQSLHSPKCTSRAVTRLDHCVFVLIPSGPGSRQLGMSPTLQCLLKFFKPAHLNSARSTYVFLSHGNHKKGACPQFTPLPLPHDPPQWFPTCPPSTWCERYSSFLGSVSIINCLLDGSCLLIHWSSHT